MLFIKDAGLDQQALMLQQKYQPSTSKEELAKVKQPVLVICGSEDSDNGSATELVKLFSHAQYVQVPGDHGGAQKTKEFADAVLKFFKDGFSCKVKSENTMLFLNFYFLIDDLKY